MSPAIDALAAESVRFDACVAPAPWTKPSIASLFTALEPQVHNVVTERGAYGARDQLQVETDVLPEEAETLARLGHPAIAHVYAAGLMRRGDAEIPWFAMELVDGAMPVTRFADARGMSLARRVELMAEVADGLHHGHLQEVVHRHVRLEVACDRIERVVDAALVRDARRLARPNPFEERAAVGVAREQAV